MISPEDSIYLVGGRRDGYTGTFDKLLDEALIGVVLEEEDGRFIFLDSDGEHYAYRLESGCKYVLEHDAGSDDLVVVGAGTL
jgi:hypothetical protein